MFFYAYTFSRPCRTNFFLTSTSSCLQSKRLRRALHPHSSRVNLQTAHESLSCAIGFKAEDRSVNRRRPQASARVEDKRRVWNSTLHRSGPAQRGSQDAASRGAKKARSILFLSVLRPQELTSYAPDSSAIIEADDIAYCRRCLAPSAMSADRIATLLVGVGERAGSLPQSKRQRIWIPG